MVLMSLFIPSQYQDRLKKPLELLISKKLQNQSPSMEAFKVGFFMRVAVYLNCYREVHIY